MHTYTLTKNRQICFFDDHLNLAWPETSALYSNRLLEDNFVLCLNLVITPNNTQNKGRLMQIALSVILSNVI